MAMLPECGAFNACKYAYQLHEIGQFRMESVATNVLSTNKRKDEPMHILTDPQSTSYARLAGLFYLIIAFAGGFSILYVPSVLLSPGDPAATAAAIRANMGLFHLGIAGEIVIILAELFVTTMLFFMFKPVNATLALAATFARLAMAIVMAVMLFFTAIALILLDGGTSVASMGVEVRESLALVFLDAHEFGVVIWQVFFTVHLFILGALVWHSGRFPKLLGAMMMVGALGYLLDSANSFMFPDSGALALVTGVLLGVVTLGEVGFALWLLIKGPKQSASIAWV